MKDWQHAVQTGELFQTRFRLRQYDGQYHWFQALANQVKDAQGQPLKWIGCHIDITSQLLAEEERTRLRHAIDQGIEGLGLLDQEGKYTYINHAHADIFGYHVDELIGQSWKILYSTDQLAYLEETCFPALHSSGNWQGELFGLRKDGTHVPVEIALSLLMNQDNSSSGLVCTCRDITERKNAEATITQATRTLEQQNQELVSARDQALTAACSKAEFLASMSHEIRTPLNGVIGMTDLLSMTDLDADQREMVETVKHSGEFLLTIINDILDFSKMDAGKMSLEEIPFDVRTTVDEVLEILAERAKSKGLELISVIDASTPQELRGDPSRIRQILFNLIGNAIKFTEQGEVVVNVSVTEEQSESSRLQVSIRDTGIGLSPEAQDRIFESFTQADGSTTRKFGGTGLGLAICKQLVTLMNGGIGVTSQKGQGSTFWFTIPVLSRSSPATSTMPQSPLQGRRLCIVESHGTIRSLLQQYAESWGMVCESAQNGRDGLALLQERARQGTPFDIAIIDQTLSKTTPEDSLSLGETIRHDPALSRMRLILLTSHGQRSDARLTQDAGFNGYLTKPVRHQQLQQCLQMVLDGETSPVASGAMQSHTFMTRHTVEGTQARAHLQILLAEDNLVNQKVAVRMLNTLGYRVDVAANGREAMEAFSRTPYNLILMDCHMPEMDGLEATRKIRKREALGVKREEEEKTSPYALRLTPHENPHVPIIALTANALPGDREMCLESGMDDFLAKPVRLEELSTMLTKWLTDQTANEMKNTSMTTHKRNDSPDRPPCLDNTVLQSLKDLGGDEDPGFFITVVEQFLEDLPRHAENITRAIDHQDTEALMKTAHACKGSSRSIGAISLADVSHALEIMGREGSLEDAATTFEEWLKEQDRTTHALQQVKSEKVEAKGRNTS